MSTSKPMPTNDANLSPADVSPQTNVVTITDNAQLVSNITYVPNSLVVTPGQPSNPNVTIAQLDNSWTITVGAGRKGSSQVADSFNSAAGGPKSEFAGSGDDSGFPSDLNFFFAVEIQSKIGGQQSSVTVYLGQGSYGSIIDPTNNWWMGGSCIQNFGSGNQVLINIGGAGVPLTGSTSSFNFG